MTINDCQTAIDISKELAKLKAFLNYNKGYDSVFTEKLNTGRGTETLQVRVPFSIIEMIVSSMVQDKIDILKKYNINTDQEENNNGSNNKSD
jgi:hypothetical protein